MSSWAYQLASDRGLACRQSDGRSKVPRQMPRLAVLRFRLGIAIGIAGCAAEIDGIAVAHHRLAEIGHTFGAANRDDAAEAVGRARLATSHCRP